IPTVFEVFLKSGPSSSVMRTIGVSSRYMMSAPDSSESATLRPGSGLRMYCSTGPLPSANAARASRCPKSPTKAPPLTTRSASAPEAVSRLSASTAVASAGQVGPMGWRTRLSVGIRWPPSRSRRRGRSEPRAACRPRWSRGSPAARCRVARAPPPRARVPDAPPAAAGGRHRPHAAAGGASGTRARGGGARATRQRAAGDPRDHLGRHAARGSDRPRRRDRDGGHLMPTLSRVLQPIGPTCPADATAVDALKRLTASGADALLVVKGGAFVGLFGHREALAAFADGSGPVEQYMRRPLPGRNVADSLESGADIMYREDTPIVLMTEDEGPLFRKTSRTVGMVSAHEVLEEIGKTTTDTASNK